MAPKRRCTDPIPTISSDDSDKETETSSPSFPRFLVIEATGKQPITAVSPFIIQKSIQGLIGTVDSVKKLKNEQLLIETNRKTTSDKILKLTDFCSLKVKVFPHPSLNSSKGVIRCPDLSGVPEEEILNELAPQEVSAVRRISFSKEGRRIPTNTLVLTFSTPHLPKTIKVGYLVVKVQIYIPNPLRCFSCQKFGHHETKCKSPVERCAKCGDNAVLHNEDHCPGPLKCVNCEGPHDCRSKSCPTWKKEQEVLKIKYTQNITFPEARKIVNDRYTAISEKSSYAAITKTTSHTSVGVDKPTQYDPQDVRSSDKIIIPTKFKNQSSSSESSHLKQPAEANTAKKSQAVSKEPPRPSGSGKTTQGQGPGRSSSQSRGRSGKLVVNTTTPVTQNRYEHLMETSDPSDDISSSPRSPIQAPS